MKMMLGLQNKNQEPSVLLHTQVLWFRLDVPVLVCCRAGVCVRLCDQ